MEYQPPVVPQAKKTLKDLTSIEGNPYEYLNTCFEKKTIRKDIDLY
jgi:hypothetical protein